MVLSNNYIVSFPKNKNHKLQNIYLMGSQNMGKKAWGKVNYGNIE
jgi:hypothetical protein